MKAVIIRIPRTPMTEIMNYEDYQTNTLSLRITADWLPEEYKCNLGEPAKSVNLINLLRKGTK